MNFWDTLCNILPVIIPILLGIIVGYLLYGILYLKANGGVKD